MYIYVSNMYLYPFIGFLLVLTSGSSGSCFLLLFSHPVMSYSLRPHDRSTSPGAPFSSVAVGLNAGEPCQPTWLGAIKIHLVLAPLLCPLSDPRPHCGSGKAEGGSQGVGSSVSMWLLHRLDSVRCCEWLSGEDGCSHNGFSAFPKAGPLGDTSVSQRLAGYGRYPKTLVWRPPRPRLVFSGFRVGPWDPLQDEQGLPVLGPPARPPSTLASDHPQGRPGEAVTRVFLHCVQRGKERCPGA